MVTAINVHRAGTTDTFTAGAAEGEGGVDLILDLNEGVKEHRTALLHIDIVGHVLGLIIGVVGVRSVNIESLELGFLFIGEFLVKLFCVVNFEHILHVREMGSNIGLGREQFGLPGKEGSSLSVGLSSCGLK